MKLTILVFSISFSLSVFSTVITNESIKEHFKSKLNTAPETKIEQEKTVVVGKCTNARKITNLLREQDYLKLEENISWPLVRKFPLDDLTRKEFKENPKYVFDRNFLPSTASIKQVRDTCMIGNGLLWVRSDDYGGKIFTLNYLSAHTKLKYYKLLNDLTKLLPEKIKESTPILKCNLSKREYRVFYNKEFSKYILQVIKESKVSDLITNGTKEVINNGPAYKFSEGDTILTITRDIRGLKLTLSKKNRSRSFDCK